MDDLARRWDESLLQPYPTVWQEARAQCGAGRVEDVVAEYKVDKGKDQADTGEAVLDARQDDDSLAVSDHILLSPAECKEERRLLGNRSHTSSFFCFLCDEAAFSEIRLQCSRHAFVPTHFLFIFLCR